MTSMRVRQPATSARNEVARSRLGHGDQLGHRLGHRDGVDGDVGEVDPGHRALGRAAQVGLGQVLGRDPGQQVRGVHDEVVVEPHLARDRARRLLGQGDEDVGRGGVGPALEQPGQQEVALLPADQVLVVVASPRGPGSSFCDLSSMRMAATSRNSDSWLKSIGSRCSERTRHEAVDHGQQRDVEDVDLVGGHEVQQEVDRTLEDWGGDRVGHPPTLPNRADASRAPRVPPEAGPVRPTMAPHGQGPLRHRALGQLHPGELPRGPAPLGVVPGRPRRLLLRRRPARPHLRDRPGRPAGQHARRRPQPAGRRARPRPLHPLRPEPRARAHPADLAARVHRHHGRAAAHDPVQGQGQGPGGRPGRALHLPGPHGGRHPPLRRRPRCRSATTSASTWS